MKNFLLSAIMCMNALIPFSANAQSAGNYLYNNPYSFNNETAVVGINTPSGNNVVLKAEVMMNVRATSYTAIFALTQSGRSAREVDSLVNERIAQVLSGLEILGIQSSEIHVDAVSMLPTYAFKIEEKKFSRRATEIPTGFEMKKNIHVLFRHHQLLDGIISEMAFAEIYDLVKVEYNIDGLQTYYEELRKAALSVIETKKATYDALKMHLDIYSLADGSSCTYPMERYKSYTAFHSGSNFQAVHNVRAQLENVITMNGKNNTVILDGAAGREALNQQLVVQTAEKNKTIFYDRMPYNQFDKVINADLEEPAIQIFYTLQANYVMITQVQFQNNLKQQQLAETASKMTGRQAKGKRR